MLRWDTRNDLWAKENPRELFFIYANVEDFLTHQRREKCRAFSPEIDRNMKNRDLKKTGTNLRIDPSRGVGEALNSLPECILEQADIGGKIITDTHTSSRAAMHARDILGYQSRSQCLEGRFA